MFQNSLKPNSTYSMSNFPAIIKHVVAFFFCTTLQVSVTLAAYGGSKGIDQTVH